MSGHQDLLVAHPIIDRCEIGHCIGNAHEFGLAAVDRVAELPASIAFQPCLIPAPSCEPQPHRQAWLHPDSVIAPAITRWPSLKPTTPEPNFSTMPTGSCPIVNPLARIFALQNVNVGSADGCGGNSDQCILRTDIRDRFVIEDDPPLLNENGGFHLLAHKFLTLLLLIFGALVLARRGDRS